MKKSFLLALLVLSGLTLCKSQDLQNHIPDYARYVIQLNAQNYSVKVNMDEVAKMDFFRAISEKSGDAGEEGPKPADLISRIFVKPSDAGVQMLPDAYAFRIEQDTVMAWCYLFNLKDGAVFGKFLHSMLDPQHPDEGFRKANGYFQMSKGLIYAAWTGSYAIIMVRDSYIPYYYMDYLEEEKSQVYNQAYEDSLQAVEMAKIQMLTDSIQAAEEAAMKKKASSKPSNNSTGTKKKPKETIYPSKEAAEEHLKYEADSIAQVITNELTKSGDFSNTGDTNWEKKERERTERKNRKMNILCEAKLNALINLSPAKSISSNRNYMEARKEKSDISFWMNSTFSDPWKKQGMAFNNLNHNQDSTGGIDGLLKNNYSMAYCNFENGKINIRQKAFINPEMDKLCNGIYKSKVNKSLLKYIKGENLMGYAAMSVNMEKSLKASKEIMVKTYEGIMGKESKYLTGMMDIAAVFTNEDVVYNLFKGDFVVAVTDLKPFKTSYLSYDYDENFNRTETRQEKTEVLPEFVAMATIGKPDEMKKILKAIEKMDGLKADGKDIYVIQIPGKYSFRIYLALENNILFCTNNEELIHSKLKSGYSKKEQMSPDQRRVMESAPIAYYWNGAKTFELISKQPEFKSSDKLMNNLNLMKDNVQDASLTGVKKEGNAYVTEGTVSLRESSVNSLFTIFKITNSFYMLDK